MGLVGSEMCIRDRVGTEYFPPEKTVPFIIQENLEGVYYLFDRVLETGIRGHVFDAYTREPIFAEIQVKELWANYVRPRVTDRETGRFYRILNPGVYTLEIKSQGYYTKIIENIRVRRGKFVDLEVGLHRKKDTLTNGKN